MADLNPLLDVSVSPIALWHAAVLATALGAEHGRTEDERQFVTLLVEPEHLTLVADWDTETTATVDGTRRPVRFRYRVPCTLVAAEREWASCRIRTMDLVRRLRSKIEHSEQYGPLQGTARIAVTANDKGEVAAVHITPEGGSARVMEATGGLSRDAIVDLVPKVPDVHVGALGADTLLEVGHVASESVGVLVAPATARTPAFVAGVGAQGAVVSAYEASEATLFDALEDRSAVLSARLATMVGWTQESLLNRARSLIKTRVQRQGSLLVAAFLAAALDVDTETDSALSKLYRSLGAEVGTRVAESVEHESSVMDRAQVAARILCEAVGEGRQADVVRGIERVGGRVNPVLAQMLKAQGGEGILGDLGVAYLGLLALDNQSAASEALACVIGEQRVLEHVRPGEAGVSTSDIALTAVELNLRSSTSVLDGILKGLDVERTEAWWEAFEAQAKHMGVDGRVVADVRARWTKAHARHQRPQSSWARISENVRSAWAKEVEVLHEGRMEVDSSGRVTFGWNEGEDGSCSISDVAVVPQVDQYPLSRDLALQMLSGARELDKAPWSMDVYSADVAMTVHRVVGLGPSRPSTDKVRGSVAFVTWSPVNDATGNEDLVTPQTVWAGETPLSAVRHPKDFPVAPARVAGTLQIVAVTRYGHKEHYRLPMRKIHRIEPTDRAFALDADGLTELMSFVTSHERDVTMEVHADGVRLSDSTGRHVSVLPRIGRDVMHEEQAQLATGLGIGTHVAPGALTVPILEARRRRVPGGVAAAQPVLPGKERSVGDVRMASDLVVPEGVVGAKAIEAADRRYRSLDAEILSVESILERFPNLEKKGAKAFVEQHGSVGAAVAALAADTLVSTQLCRSTARGAFERVVRDVREAGVSVATLPDEAMDLFQGMSVGGNARGMDRVAERSWEQFVGAAKLVRRRLVRRHEDLLSARGIQTPVLRGARPGKPLQVTEPSQASEELPVQRQLDVLRHG